MPSRCVARGVVFCGQPTLFTRCVDCSTPPVTVAAAAAAACIPPQGGLPGTWGNGSAESAAAFGAAAELPPVPVYLRAMEELECAACGLSGSLAWHTRDWRALHKLRRVMLPVNALTGPVPSFGAPLLQELDLSDNPLGGSLSPWWAYEMPALRRLALAGTNMSGVLPPGAAVAGDEAPSQALPAERGCRLCPCCCATAYS